MSFLILKFVEPNLMRVLTSAHTQQRLLNFVLQINLHKDEEPLQLSGKMREKEIKKVPGSLPSLGKLKKFLNDHMPSRPPIFPRGPRHTGPNHTSELYLKQKHLNLIKAQWANVFYLNHAQQKLVP
jgi:hypothetical protein